MTIAQLADILHARGCSCVICSHGAVTLCHERGVKDLLRILKQDPGLLRGASVADKVIGKGAAALMILGGVSEVYADVISQPAIALFRSTPVKLTYKTAVPNIINRTGTGICPVETLCRDCATPAQCLPLIENFIAQPK